MDDRLRKEAGRAGEAAALAHLEQAGLQLVLRNFRCKRGEIDLVMLDGATLVLVEVRYRSSEQFGGAAASVTWRKQRRLDECGPVSAARASGAAPLSGALRRRRDLGGAGCQIGVTRSIGSRARSHSDAGRNYRSQLSLLRGDDHNRARPLGRRAVVHRRLQRLLPADDRVVSRRGWRAGGAQRRGCRLMWRRLRISSCC